MASGLLIINKPAGITSHDVVARVRKITGLRKVGHTGTLDPMATGVLVVCLGQATRLIEYIMAVKKQYRAVIRFGVTTDTLDADGTIVARSDASALTETDLNQALPPFLGDIDQRPPIFSAIKKGGRPLYKRARAGQSVEVPLRSVTIYQLDWVDWHPPDLTLDVVCSPGTYIRSLARDLGDAVGVGAHLAGLQRTANGDWTLDEAIALADLTPDNWQTHLLPVDSAAAHLPKVVLNADNTVHIKHGRKVELDSVPQNSGVLRAYSQDNTFLAILTHAEDNLWRPKKVFQI
jgi:tRNA pseudouridine55 synthase